VAFTLPDFTAFKARFDRDFRYSADASDQEGVRDTDVTRAFTSAKTVFNAGLWPDQETCSEAFLLCSAHFLCTNLNAGGQGLRGQGWWLLGSKGMDGMSQSQIVPERVQRSPLLASLSKTPYGLQYVTIMIPFMVGNVVCVQGDTTP
jgi:hypothetical protein